MAFIRSGGFRILLWIAAGGAFVAGAAAAIVYLSLTRDLPDLETIEDYRPPLTSRVVDRHGNVIAEFSRERRHLATMEEIPEHARLAFVSAEDKGFFEHKGIDYSSILRAALANLRAGGRYTQGASTITQQTVKSLLLTPEKTIRRKFREMILAREIEQHLTKDEILYLYLNQIYFGNGAWGIAEAARTYFDKDVSELDVSESALLAGLPQRPNAWQPFRNPEGADKRRRYVLGRMLEDGVIDQEQYDEAIAKPVEPKAPGYRDDYAPAAYFSELVRRYLFDRFGGDTVLEGGLVIETTVDLELQRVAVEALRKGLEEQDRRAGYRGPLRQVAEADFAAEIQKIGEANELLRPEPEVEEPVVAEADDGERQDAAPAEAAPSDETQGGLGASSALASADAEGAGASAEGEGETLADTDATPEAELLPLPEVPFDEPLLGLVVAVDRKAESATVKLAPEIEGRVALADVEWARPPDPDRRPRPMSSIAKVFAVGDVVHFRRLEDPSPEADEASPDVADDAAPEPPARLTIHQVPLAQGSLLSLDIHSGDVMALVGGYDFTTSQFDRVTQALRQPGSAFKPFIYGAAIAQGYTPVQTLFDRPIVYEDPVTGFKYKPQNYERRFFGPVPMRFALAHSINNATVHLFRDVGVDYVIDFARRLGIQSPLERDLSLAIGSSSVTLLELTSAYAVFPNGGRRVVPRYITRVTDRDGQVLLEDVALGDPAPPVLRPLGDADAEAGDEAARAVAARDQDDVNGYPDAEIIPTDQILSEQTAYLICDLMKAVVTEGTGQRLKSLGRPLAGKTGTTNDFADAWFMGFSPDIVTGVWVGHDQAAVRLGWGESGARAALPIWKEYMEAALADLPVRDFEVPEGIVFERIDRETGLLADYNSTDVYFQPFLEGTVPTRTSGDATRSSDTQRAMRSDAF